MKYFFRNKTNVILTILLVLCTAGIVFTLFFMEDSDFIAADYSGMNESEIKEWMAQRNITEYEIEYEYSDTVSEGCVIHQSVKAGDEFTEITIVISKGKEESLKVELPEVNEDLTREDLEEFFEKNGFTDVTFEYAVSDKPKDTVIKMNVSGTVSVDTLILVTVSAGEDAEALVVKVPDFSNYTISEVQAWAKSNSITLKIDYNVSDTVDKGKVLSQSVLKDTEIHAGDTLKVVISDGKGITIPDFSKMKKDEVESWAKENEIENLTITESYSETIEKDYVISNKPKTGVVISKDYPVTVVVSKGKEIKVQTGYEGKSVSDLEKYVQSLNSTLTVKDNKERYYSDSYAKDTVYSYTTGTVEDNDIILYALSLGKFSANASEYNGLTKTKAEEVVASYTAKKASLTIEFTSKETTDSNKIGITYDCSVSGNKVSCSLGVKEVPQITASDYDNLSESEAKNNMSEYKKSYSEGSISFTYGDVSALNKGKTYGCTVSGKNTVSCMLYRDEFTVSSFNGKTRSEVESAVSNYNNTYSTSYTTSFTEISTNEYDANKTYGCALSGNSVSCNIAKEIMMAQIMDPDAYAYFVTSTYEGTKTNLEEVFSDFTNVTYQGVSSTKAVGQIVSITVDGVENSYEAKDYPADTTTVIIKICNNRTN